MRVLIDYRPALVQRTGVGEYAHQLARALTARDGGYPAVEVTIFSSSWKQRLSRHPELGGVRMVDARVPVSVLNFLWHRAEWPPVERLAHQTFDVVHSLHPLLIPTRGAAQVITIHDLDFVAHPERTTAEIRRDYPALAPAHAHRADAIIVPSKFTGSEVQKVFGIAADQIFVCSPGAPSWPPRSHAPEAGYLLFFGTLEPRKNVGALLDAYEQAIARPGSTIPDLVLAGKATPAARPWLERIARAPLAGRVRHVGYVDPDHRRALYEGACLLAQPSYEEGFGLPVLEAMTIGVPVVAANRGALPEVVGDAGLLADPAQPDEFAAALERLATDRHLASACALRGIERARAFQWAGTARRVLAAYGHAVAHRAGRS